MFSAWHLWAIAAIFLFIVEIFTPAFVLASFGVGCLFSSLAAGFGFGIKTQIVGFIVGTLIAFFGVRPLFTKYCYKASSGVKTNVEAMVGETGRVSETIDAALDTGRVLVRGDDWKAVSVDGSVIEKGARVEVVEVRGPKILVRSI